MSGHMSSQSELEVLFQATRQIESILNRERNEAVRTKNELSELQTKHEREVTQARNQAKHYAAFYQQLRVRYQEAVSRAHELAHQISRLQQALADQQSNAQEIVKRNQMELDVAKSSAQHLQQSYRVMELQLEQLRPEVARAKSELERVQSEALERDHNYQSALLSHRSREKSLLDTLAALKEKLQIATSELAEQKTLVGEAERARSQADEEATRENHRKWIVEKTKREKAEANAAVAEGEKRLLTSSLRATEARLRDAEERIASLSASASLRESAPAFDFESIEEVAVTGYPVVRAPHREV